MRTPDLASKTLSACGSRIGGWLAVGLMSALLAGCTSLRVGNDYDRSADLSGFHRFAWMSREHHGSRNPLVVQRARDAIEAELIHKGFIDSADPATADFIVDFTIGSSDRVDVQSYPTLYGMAYRNYPDWWGYQYWGNGIDARRYREGTLSIDVFDARTHKPVWHGWATKELTRSDLENSQAPIQAAVKAILAKFPPRH